MKKIIIFCLFFLTFTLVAYCQKESRIELIDGSVINGEITSYTGGVYTIKTDAFGEIKLESLKISRIKTENPSLSKKPLKPTVAENNVTQSQFQSYGQAMMSNPQNAAIITGLATDPQIQELAKDPEIAEAAKIGDIQALMNNEKFMKAVNNLKIQGAVKELKQ